MPDPVYVRPLGYLSFDEYYADELKAADEDSNWPDDESSNPVPEHANDAT